MRIVKLIGAVCFSLVTSLSASAAIPTFINYQGFLTDTDGNALDTTADVTFRIFDTDVGGTALWSESQTVTSVNGLFTVYLGVLTPIDESIIDGNIRFLEVQLNASPFSPRSVLAASPYAIRIATIDGASGGAITGSLELSNSNATDGNILKEGLRFINNFGTQNTFIGVEAGNLTMAGYGNTASGFNAFQSNTEGSQNTACGGYALASNTIGFSNTASGHSALYNNTTGSSNTAIGFAALTSNTTGGVNTASGDGALMSNTTGNGNTAIGFNALYNNTEGINNTASGIGSLRINTIGSNNTASGLSALFNNTTGNNNTACGDRALLGNTTGNNNTAIGFGADVSSGNLTNATSIGANAFVNASNKIRLGNTNVTVIEGQVAYTFTSDKTQKENFRPVTGKEVLEKIRGLELSSWNYKGHDPKQFRHYGPMAQDFFAAFGDDGIGKIGTETTLNSGDVAGILMIAVQALSKQNEEIENENQDLRNEMKELREMVQKLLAQEGTPDQTYTVSRQ